MPSKVTLQFDSPSLENETLILRNNVGVGSNLLEIFTLLRIGAYFTTIGADVSEERVNYRLAFNADYNNTQLYSVLLVGVNQLTIEHSDNNHFDNANITNTTSGIVVVSVENTPDVTPINITDVTFLAATNICGDVKVQITTDVLATKITSPIQVDPNTNNPFTFDWVRGEYITISVENSEGETTNQNIQLPKSLSASNTSVSVVNSPNGASLTINVAEIDGLTLQYSLDDTTYQSSNSYPSLVEGNYTAYVKDQFGCKIQYDFTIENFEDGGQIGVRTPYAELPSKSNSLRFKEVVAWDTCSNYKTDENTLSCESDVKIPYTEVQQFQTCDSNVETQIRSNFNDIKVFVIRENGAENPIAIEQKSQLIGLKDKRDAIKYQYKNKTGVYFTSGQTYDYDTGDPLGTYALNGALPYWGKIGNYIYLDGTWYEIENKIWDDVKKADVLIINQNYTGAPTSVIVTSIYNQEEYEEWEFAINMNNYPDETIQVRIDEEDSSFDTVTFISEKINVKTKQPNTVEIKYKHDENTDINYSYGIEHIIRAIKEKRDPKKEDESDTHKTDSKSVLLSGKVYELDEFQFEPVTTEIMRKMVLAFHHSILTMDGVGYVKTESGSVEVEGPLEDSNLYAIKAILIKTGKGFTTSGVSSGGTTIDVPKLQGDGAGNFVRY